MSRVINVSGEDWYVMRQLRESIPWMQNKNKDTKGKFDLAIKREQELYKETLQGIFSTEQKEKE